jgi:hypothetical protein
MPFGILGDNLIYFTGDYKISDTDTSGPPNYYGYLDPSGAWFIMRENAGAYRYAKGKSGYADAWTGKGILSYGYFSGLY